MTGLAALSGLLTGIPGSTELLRAVAQTWRTRAADAERAAEALHVLRIANWTGAAADAFTARAATVRARWLGLADTLAAAADAVDAHATTLAWAQEQAATAVNARSDAATVVEALDVLQNLRAQVRTSGDAAAAALTAAAALEGDAAADEAGGPASGLLLAAVSTLAWTMLSSDDPATVAEWWDGLEADAREHLIETMPARIGNLEGVDYTSRDRANRRYLDDLIDEARSDLAAAQARPQFGDVDGGAQNPALLDAGNAQARIDALESITAALRPAAHGSDRFLVSLAADQPPLAAISIGDLDAAENITYVVPGMGTTTANMTRWADASQNVATAQALADPSRTQAVVAWVGYETPPVASISNQDVLRNDHAEAGAERLDRALQGVDARRSDAALNVVAHSYGTTTASIALTETEVRVDTFVSIGSAGLRDDIDEATDLHADAVYAGQAGNVSPWPDLDGDQWAWIGRAFGDHPVDPTGDDFGATTFGTRTGGDVGTPVDDHSVHTDGGSGYLDVGTESLRNIALITTGNGAFATAGE